MNKKRRLLIPITVQFSVRYIVRSGLLYELQNICDPVLLLNWKDAELEQELKDNGIEYHYLPVSKFGKIFNYISKINGLKHKRKINSASAAIDKRRLDFLSAQTKKSLKQRLATGFIKCMSYLFPVFLLKKIEVYDLEKTSNFYQVLAQMKQLNIDNVLTITPFVNEEFLVLKSFEKLQVPISYSVLSFDNLTTRGYLPVKFNNFFVWNTINKNEVLRLFGKSTRVDIVGPVQFDFYWNKDFIWSREKWKNELNITTGRPIILFGGGHFQIVPNEPDWLFDIDQAISDGEIINNPIILFRIHPLDPAERWTKILGECKNVIADEPWKPNHENLATINITDYDISKLCSTLKWTDIHVNASSTLTLDGAIFDKPQIGPAYSEHNVALAPILKDLYYREHYLPITESGGLQIAYSKEALINYLNEGLSEPGKYSAERKKMVDLFCEDTYGESARRLASQLAASVLI